MVAHVGAARIRAWNPGIAGIHDVFHGRFTDHAYPKHTHDVWTPFIVDDGATRYDLEYRAGGAETSMVSILPPNVVHDGRAADARGFTKRVLYLETSVIDEALIGAAVDDPVLHAAGLRSRVAALYRPPRPLQSVPHPAPESCGHRVDEAIDVPLGVEQMRRDANPPLAHAHDDIPVSQFLIELGSLVLVPRCEATVRPALRRVQGTGRNAVFGEAFEQEIDQFPVMFEHQLRPDTQHQTHRCVHGRQV